MQQILDLKAENIQVQFLLINIVLSFILSLLQHAFSRAYINFKRFEDVTIFRNLFDGFIFNAGKGRVIFNLISI